MESLTFTVPLLVIAGAVASFIIWVVKLLVAAKLDELRVRKNAFVSHIELCNQKNIEFALLKRQVDDLKQQIESDRKARHWIGDCIQIIGSKIHADLPERPL